MTDHTPESEVADEMIHVVPLNDLREHEESEACWCRPVEIFEGAGVIIVHNSMDRREHTIEKGKIQ